MTKEEEATNSNSMRTLSKTTKKMRGDYKTSKDKPAKALDCKTRRNILGQFVTG